MVQKIIQIGSSAGVTIPKKQLQEMGLRIGDEVTFTVKPVKKPRYDKLMRDYETFVAQYGETLKNLVDR